MQNSVYPINKGINKSIEFKGLKAQYIWHLGGVVVALLILFATMYLLGLNSFLCLAVILAVGTILILKIYRMSHTYGEHGMMKSLAGRALPTALRCYSREVFFGVERRKLKV